MTAPADTATRSKTSNIMDILVVEGRVSKKSAMDRGNCLIELSWLDSRSNLPHEEKESGLQQICF